MILTELAYVLLLSLFFGSVFCAFPTKGNDYEEESEEENMEKVQRFYQRRAERVAYWKKLRGMKENAGLAVERRTPFVPSFNATDIERQRAEARRVLADFEVALEEYTRGLGQDARDAAAEEPKEGQDVNCFEAKPPLANIHQGCRNESVAWNPIDAKYGSSYDFGANVHTSCRKNGYLALTFDDGPSEYTSWLLDILAKHHVKATFFVLGENVSGSRERNCLRRMRDEGHIIASHTWSHTDLTSLGQYDIEYEMKKTNRLIEDITGLRPRFMRPPYGHVNDYVVNCLNNMGFEVINWNLDTDDWQNPDSDAIYHAYTYVLSTSRRPSSSYICLQHDTYDATVSAQERIISYISHDTSYKLVAMDKCLSSRPYA